MLVVKESKTSGKGVFTEFPIADCSLVLTFGGSKFKRAEIPSGKEALYLQIDSDLYLGPSGELDDFVNHSCNPNCFVRLDTYHNLKLKSICLIAMRDIESGEELTFDYSLTMLNDPYQLECKCASEQCRGRIVEFKNCPREWKKAQIRMGLVPNYNRSHGE